jgi:hypothetical protein
MSTTSMSGDGARHVRANVCHGDQLDDFVEPGDCGQVRPGRDRPRSDESES